MNKYQIWLGQYNLGQGYGNQLREPLMVAEIESVNFKTACMKYELQSKMDRILEGEKKNNLNSQDYPWWFNENTISSSWTGRYFESREEALKTFK